MLRMQEILSDDGYLQRGRGRPAEAGVHFIVGGNPRGGEARHEAIGGVEFAMPGQIQRRAHRELVFRIGVGRGGSGAAGFVAEVQVELRVAGAQPPPVRHPVIRRQFRAGGTARLTVAEEKGEGDRKSTRLNSSHQIISYAVFCLKKKKKSNADYTLRVPSTH